MSLLERDQYVPGGGKYEKITVILQLSYSCADGLCVDVGAGGDGAITVRGRAIRLI